MPKKKDWVALVLYKLPADSRNIDRNKYCVGNWPC